MGTVDTSTPGVWTERTAGVDYHPATGTLTRRWIRERTWSDCGAAMAVSGTGAVGHAARWVVRWVWTTATYVLVLCVMALLCAIGGLIAHAGGANPLVGIAVVVILIAAVVAAEDA
jgi:hypothetical protein